MQQLPLFALDEIDGQCPHCGHRAPLRAFTPARRERVLADPRLDALPDATRTFVEQAPDPFLMGAPVGPALFDHHGLYSRSAAHKQLRRLVDYGLVETRPKRPGGQYKLYQLCVG